MFFFKKAPKAAVILFNTKGRKKEVFEPLAPGVVRLYSCGPTVYGPVHIGNVRSVLLSDLVRRTLEYAGYRVKQVMNITDFGHLAGDGDEGEDKMLSGLRREGLEPTMENMLALAGRYAEAFTKDLLAIGAKMPHVLPRASEHVPSMVAYVHTLLDKGYAYQTSDGVYFEVAKFPPYGALGGSASAEHSRVGISGEKRDQRDFALWKFNADRGWQAPWGTGVPGWHIECTAMATRYLGKSFDIHTGGVDNIPIHHNNEIAQAEAANGRPYARFWLHNEFITVDGAKIAKSVGNTITLAQLRARGIHPRAYRYWLMTGQYRQAMNFTWEAVEAAEVARGRALRAFADLPKGGSVVEAYRTRFEAALYDDLNTPEAIAILWELLKDAAVSPADTRATLLVFDRVLGIGFNHKRDSARLAVHSLPRDIQEKADERESARKAGEWGKADALREEIEARGYAVEDSPEGPRIKKVNN